MGNQGQERNGFPFLAGEEAEHVKRIALEKKALAHSTIQSVYQSMANEFHKHIRLLPQKEKVMDKQYALTAEQRQFGLYSYHGKTYVETLRPYVDVEGRIEQMIAVHKVHEESYVIHTFPEQIGEQWVMTCQFEGLNKYGQPFKTIERSIIGFGATSGVDSTNPIENASTSAVGRALSHGGYGNIGGGLSSYEDIYMTNTRQRAHEKLKNEGRHSDPVAGQPFGQNGTLTDEEGQPQGSEQQSHGGEQSASHGNSDRSQSQSNGSRGSSSSNNGYPTQGPAGQHEKNRKREKNKFVSRFLNGTKNWDKQDLKNKVQAVLQITSWDGKFTSFSLDQLQLLEERMGTILQAS
ncbi:hypothetical protein [Paenibacillus sp. GCM10023250]|uniref:hypothetical protein n=1 Tax=Paenibacillus sp. GCM10023250 TaxID=3252648 RepID=UPI003609B037